MQSTFHTLRKTSKALFPKGGWRQPRMFASLWMQGPLHSRLISEANRYNGPGNLSKVLNEQPDFWGVLIWPLVDARWTPDRRVRELMQHYREAFRLGKLLDLQLHEVRTVLKLDGVADSLEVCLERQPWFRREGQVTLSLFHAGERVYSLAFLLSHKNGRRIAYIGAIQGVKQSEDSDIYKDMTKGAHGLRPRDLVIALFLQLCEAMRVSQVYAVQDEYRQHRHRYFGVSGKPEVYAQYDSIWTENGGVMGSNGMYVLAPGVRKRNLADVPSKKRSMYRKREAFLENCQSSFHALVEANINDKAYHGTEVCMWVRPSQVRDGIVQTWLNKVRPAFVGSWLWSFPAIFM